MENTYIGAAVERVEDMRFLKGRGQFVDDLAIEGSLHAVLVRSPVAHGLIRKIDSAAALAVPGVQAVITAADIGSPVPRIPLRLWALPELQPYEQPVIADKKVRYVGEPVAVVIAESGALAEDAANAVELEIEPLDVVNNCSVALAGRSLLHDAQGTNVSIIYKGRKGNAEAAFASAHYVRREQFAVQRHMAMTMEPRGLVAKWDPEAATLTVWGAAKVPFFNRATLARLFNLAEGSVELIENDVGGGFGARGEFLPEDFLIPFAAKFVNRPVKWIEDRREHLLTMSHAREMDCDIELACTREGLILGLRGRVHADVGAYFRTNGTVSPRNATQFMAGPYRIPNIEVDSYALMTNKAPIGTYRGPGRFEVDFFRERMFDIVARELGIDPVEFRRRNLVMVGEMPYSLGAASPPERTEELDSGDYIETLDQCIQEFGWSEKQKLQGKLTKGEYHGIAIGCFVEGGAAGPRESARIVVERDGTISVFVGSTAVGQGLETVLSQIAADALEVPLERIRLFHGSTSYVKEGFGSFHSRSTVMGGSAILLAAQTLGAMLRREAATRLGCAEGEVSLADEEARGPRGDAIRWRDLAAAGANLSVEETFSNHKHTYAYGAAAAHVGVNPKTGIVRVLDYLLIEDVGRIVNPLTLQGQAIGSIVQGLGGTFLEHLAYDANGQLLTGSLADYLVPVATDFPNIRAIMVQRHKSPNNPLGAKGAGEGGIISVGGVIANAVAAALGSLGVSPRQLPLSPSNVWQLIDEARAATR